MRGPCSCSRTKRGMDMTSSSGRYKSQAGQIFVQRQPVRVLLTISKEEVAYWVELFEQMTAFFKRQKGAVIDIDVCIAHNAQEALGYVSQEYDHPMDLVISRLHIKRAFENGVFDLLRAVYAGHAARVISKGMKCAIPAVVMYDNIDDTVTEYIYRTFEDQVEAGAVLEYFSTSTPGGKKMLVRRAIKLVADVLDQGFSPFQS